ncbi:PAS domain-containing protein [Pontibacter pamirensis]|uniref:PAS domain-containing protein n=1 Tax=Pontibacter pamirensis TaxID=2562824 RepID=UPI001389B0C0|nr:PAS domain-containing protein [Pontibacter pamirensis]
MRNDSTRTNSSSDFQKALEQNQVDVQQEYKSLLKIIAAAPDAYLILSPDLKIQFVSDAYLAATKSVRKDLLGKYIFDAFTESSATPDANAVKNLHSSLKKVLNTKKPHQMELQHYHVPKPTHLGGGFEEKHWSTSNTPVLNDSVEVSYIIHKVTEVTELVRSQEKVKDLKGKRLSLQATLNKLQNIQQKLEEEQRRLEDAQTLGHIGSFEAAYPYDAISWSDELYRIHGLEPQSEKITSEAYAAYVHPDDKEMYAKALDEFYKGNKSLNHIYKIVRRDKVERDLHLKGKVVRDATNRAIIVMGTIQDITEQVQAQQILRENEMLLRETEQVGHVGSYYGDIATLTFRFSEGMFRLLGLVPEDKVISLEQIDASSHPDDALVVRQILEQAIRDKQPYEYLRRIYRRDGQMRYLHSTGKVKCDSDGKAVRFVGIVHDITEQKQAEEKIRQSELHIRTLIDNTPDVITRWDKDLRIIFNNQSFVTSTDLPVPLLLLQETVETEQPENMRLSLKEKVMQVLQTGETPDHNNSYALPHGRVYYHSQLVAEFSEDGTIESVLVITRDISALKRLEKENLELRLNQQRELLLAIMETQEAERRRIAEALHNGIGQLLYGAKLNLDKLTKEEIAQDVSKVKASVMKTDQMLEQAITQVRSISHELTPSVLEHFGLEVAMKQICAIFNTEKLEFQCLVFSLRSDLERHLQISTYRMAQELANNIVKHAQATEASLLLREHKDSLVLLAEDNGKGFELEHIQTKGIGIKSIQDRVKLLSGTIRINSAPGQGTLIQITLPITTPGQIQPYH